MAGDLATLRAVDESHEGGARRELPPVVAYLDIETASSGEWVSAAMRAAAAEGLDQAAAVARMVEAASEHALNPRHGRVICWALGTSRDTEWVRSGTDERDLLMRLHRALIMVQPTQIVAHNGAGFDFPFLRMRALAHQLDELAQWFWAPKPWDTRLVDTCVGPEWLPAPPRHGRDGWPRSLDDVAETLGVARAKTIPGSEVPRAWYLGQRAEVEAHCLDDVKTLRWVHRRLAAGRTT